MIKLVRLDERLIHGQVAIKWSRHTGVDRIVVANDEAAGNKIIQQSLMMAAPATAKVTIRSVADSITLLKDPRAAGHKILVIISNPKDLIKILEEVKDIPLINVGTVSYTHLIQVVFWAYPLTWLMSSVIFFYYYRHVDWMHAFDAQ